MAKITYNCRWSTAKMLIHSMIYLLVALVSIAKVHFRISINSKEGRLLAPRMIKAAMGA
jgi:hypothetical protein